MLISLRISFLIVILFSIPLAHGMGGKTLSKVTAAEKIKISSIKDRADMMFVTVMDLCAKGKEEKAKKTLTKFIKNKNEEITTLSTRTQKRTQNYVDATIEKANEIIKTTEKADKDFCKVMHRVQQKRAVYAGMDESYTRKMLEDGDDSLMIYSKMPTPADHKRKEDEWRKLEEDEKQVKEDMASIKRAEYSLSGANSNAGLGRRGV